MLRGGTADLWQGLPPSMQSALVKNGLDEPDVFVNLFTTGDNAADDIIQDFCVQAPEGDELIILRERLLLMRDVMASAAARSSERRAAFSTVAAAAAVTISARKRQQEARMASLADVCVR